jgi:hypothetical protein
MVHKITMQELEREPKGESKLFPNTHIHTHTHTHTQRARITQSTRFLNKFELNI